MFSNYKRLQQYDMVARDFLKNYFFIIFLTDLVILEGKNLTGKGLSTSVIASNTL